MMAHLYDSPVWTLEREVITEVANIKEEGLVIPEHKNFNFISPSVPQIEKIDIGHKSLPIILGP